MCLDIFLFVFLSRSTQHRFLSFPKRKWYNCKNVIFCTKTDWQIFFMWTKKNNNSMRKIQWIFARILTSSRWNRCPPISAVYTGDIVWLYNVFYLWQSLWTKQKCKKYSTMCVSGTLRGSEKVNMERWMKVLAMPLLWCNLCNMVACFI